MAVESSRQSRRLPEDFAGLPCTDCCAPQHEVKVGRSARSPPRENPLRAAALAPAAALQPFQQVSRVVEPVELGLSCSLSGIVMPGIGIREYFL